jgi:hypothetical protein
MIEIQEATENSTTNNNNNNNYLTIEKKLQVEIRFLTQNDITELKELFADSFPVQYPLSWFESIVSNQRFYSIAAVYKGTIIGSLVADVKTSQTLSKDDRLVLMNTIGKNSSIAYILSLGKINSNYIIQVKVNRKREGD